MLKMVIIQYIIFIHSRLTAWNSIGISIFYKIISSIAVYTTTKSSMRAFLQFCALLLSEDIYDAHKRVVTTYTTATTIATTSHVNANNEQILGFVISISTKQQIL